MDSDSYYVMILDSCGKVVWKYGCDMVMCAKNEEDIAKLSGTLRIYRTGQSAYGHEWDWRVFGDISKTGDPYYRYTQKPAKRDITFAEDDGSPCDTGECDCYMGPIYSVFVGALEFEETRSPDPAETWGLFLPILERNPGFAERGARMGEVEE